MTLATAERTEIQKAKPTEQNAISTRFLNDVERQFLAELGQGPKFTEFERRLTQHMYLKTDAALKLAESKRRQGEPMTWHTVDRQKLALDTVHRVSLGLDALIPNHIHPVLYWNNHKGAYDVDLQIGYVGRDLIARRHAVEAPLQVVYELVYDTDHFKALPRSSTRDVEGYEFEITQPFDRGNIVGGFGYIVYEDARKNRLVLVTKRDFARSKGASRSSFWRDNEVEMHLKTVILRTCAKIPLDPTKVNAAAYAAISAEEVSPVERAEADVEVEVKASANRQLVDVDQRTVDAEPARADEPTEDEQAEIQAREVEEASLFADERAQATRRAARQASAAPF